MLLVGLIQPEAAIAKQMLILNSSIYLLKKLNIN